MKRALLFLALAPLLLGCTNTLAFGTATKLGLDISQRPDRLIDVTFGYDRYEVVSIPARPDHAQRQPGDDPCELPRNVSSGASTARPAAGRGSDASGTSTRDTYSVLGIFSVAYGNPWKDEPLTLRQFFATGWAARHAACDPKFQEFFGHKTGEIISKDKDAKDKEEGK